MAAKIQAAIQAVEKGVGAVVIASGKQPRTLQQILHGDNVGTLFMQTPLSPQKPQIQLKGKKTNDAVREMATRARDAGRLLQALSGEERDAILYRIADGLLANSDRILAANRYLFYFFWTTLSILNFSSSERTWKPRRKIKWLTSLSNV
jgi:delta-1-pyrroline-5-carboxylate synthetase